MQTFLPYADFTLSAQSLDRQRLGKQRVEAKQIVLALRNPNYGWQHHPAVNMWRGYEAALMAYGTAICGEWRSRGYQDTLLDFFRSDAVVIMPPWLGDERVHRSHRANLVRKDPNHYQFNEEPTLGYFWPGEAPLMERSVSA